MTKSNQQAFREYCYTGPAYLFDVTGYTLNGSGVITLDYSSSDSRSVLPSHVPRPTSGSYLGHSEDLIERRSCKLQGVEIGGDPTAFAEFELADHVMALEGKLLFTADDAVLDLFRFPQTSPGSGLSRQNRSATISTRSLLVIRINANPAIRYFVQATLYYRCAIRPADEALSTKGVEPLDFYALIGSRLDEDDDDCLTESYTLSWLASVDSDGVNTLITS